MFKNALMVKVLVLLGLMLLFVLPTSIVEKMVSERQSYQQEVFEELTKSNAGKQKLAGPILVVPYKFKKNGVMSEQRLLVLPEQLDIAATVNVTPIQRAIYTFQTYQSQSKMTGYFDLSELKTLKAQGAVLGTPEVAVAISDARGLAMSEGLNIAGVARPLRAGTNLKGLPQGVHALLRLDDLNPTQLPFEITMAVNGSAQLGFIPLGKNTKVRLNGNWAHPKFAGDASPVARTVNEQGFEATWQTNWFANNLNTTLVALENQEHHGEGMADGLYSVHTDLIQTVDHYQLNDRAVKYSMLLIGLTFLSFFMFEMLRQLRVHPMQYALVGVALVVFYTLLLALSERIGFARAYAVAAVACVGQIGFYVSHILHSVKRGVGFGAALAALYAAVYGLLQSEDNALLLGSVGVFAVVSMVMFATRRLNWYRLDAGQ